MKYFSDYMQSEQSALYDKLGAFFAFGNQFEEHRVEGVEYVSVGYGLVCPKINVKRLVDGFAVIIKSAVIQDLEENGAAAIIKREYFNHECQISCDTDNALNSLSSHIKYFPDQFTPELIQKVFIECWNEAVELDLF